MASQSVFSAMELGTTAEAIAVFSDSGCGAALLPSYFSKCKQIQGENYVQFCSLEIILLNSLFRTSH
jgi:hypothetical protein